MKNFREKASANYHIRLRSNRELENTFRAYETSWETERLGSEQNRQIYCELFDFNRNKNPEEVSEIPDLKTQQNVVVSPSQDEDDHEEAQVTVVGEKRKWWTQILVESNRPKSLVELSINKLAANYKSGPLSSDILCQDSEDFGLLADIELPILNLLELQNETFWKRVVQANVNDILRFQNLLRDPSTNWKKIGVELKFIEFIESLEEAQFDEPSTVEILKQLTDKLNHIIEDIPIKTLKPRKNLISEKARTFNFPSDECYHGSLKFLGGLTNLKSLLINFNPGFIERNYSRRLFQVATIDVENIGEALPSLKSLESFAILESDLSESMKVYHLLRPMKLMENLNRIDLSYCNIKSKESGEHFEEFLSDNRVLKHLELRGNNFDSEFCVHFAHGIDKFSGRFNYLGLSLIPIFGNGLGLIIKSINDKNNVEPVDISKCDNGWEDNGRDCWLSLISLIEREGFVQEINMNCNLITSQMMKENFIRALDKNYKILELSCEDCGFSTSEMVQIKVLVCRNSYYKDNPILKKDHFTAEDETRIEKWLKRTKHPLLIKYKKEFAPPIDALKP